MLKKIKEFLYRSLTNGEITYQELERMINTDEKAILLDVRSPQEYREAHLEKAVNVPLYDLEKKLNYLPDKECTIITYCAGGNRSRKAKDELEILGYKNVYNLKNGLDGI